MTSTMLAAGQPIYIAGVAETALGEVTEDSEFSMVAKAAREALSEAGLSLRDVDGLFVNYLGEQGSVQVAEYLGISPRYSDSTDLGGAAFEAQVHHVFAAMAAGSCEVALICYASRQRTRRSRSKAAGFAPFGTPIGALLDAPHGLPAPIGHYAMIAARHMHQYGTTREQLAEIAVAARAWAMRNPKAWSRKPLTIEDALASRPISTPLHRADCCLVTDGGGVLVLTKGDRARDAAKRPIRVLGAAEAHTHWNITQMPDLTVTAGAQTAARAFGMAGVSPADVDVLQPYDSFTITVLLALEDLGFCAKGEGGAFVAGGALAPGGALPAMTSGGGLSYCHPGALGLLLLVEAVRQLRGEAGDRQVADAQIAVAHGVGGFLSTAGTVVLGRD
jgi:acetyl-CoA acetyltransferase